MLTRLVEQTLDCTAIRYAARPTGFERGEPSRRDRAQDVQLGSIGGIRAEELPKSGRRRHAIWLLLLTGLRCNDAPFAYVAAQGST
jgi:hypothetical protein